MRKKTAFIHLLVILLFTGAFAIHELGTGGRLGFRVFNDTLYPAARRVSAMFTDLKFAIRGKKEPKSPIVIVEIDSPSITEIGRWPWSRDYIAYLIQRTFQRGAKVVGLDMVFSEPEHPVPEDLVAILSERGMGDLARQFDTDPKLAEVIRHFGDSLVLSWVTESPCQPPFSPPDRCPVTHPDALAALPENISKFAYTFTRSRGEFRPEKTPVMSTPVLISNLALFSQSAKHQGFANSFRDPDGIVRRTSLAMMVDKRAYPSLPLELARVALNEDLEISLDDRHRVNTVTFARSGRRLPVTGSGVTEINFRGPERTFRYVSARDVLRSDDEEALDRSLSSSDPPDILKGAIALIGVSALALSDIAATPFDATMAGVEVHANVLDNLLAGDLLQANSWGVVSTILLILLMTVGAIAFLVVGQRLDAVPLIGLVIGTLSLFFFIDVQFLFKNNQNWNTGFLYLEILSLATVIVASRYVAEEQQKKFISVAFSKYVAPEVVKSIIRDPQKLMLGGQRKELTVLFSDIRGFTSFSETMDAKMLSEFLNDYFGLMTDVLFQFNGTLDKYIGDALMAFFGAPADDRSHSLKACEAARMMIRTLAVHRPRFKQKYGIEVDIGVGLNSGLVSVGNMGSNQSFGYTVIGDNVNLASRLEGVTKKYGVNILTTHLTMADIQATEQPMPPNRMIDIVKVKGKADAVQLFQILDAECNPDGLLSFEEGRELYRSRAWDAAIEKFEQASPLLSPDPMKPDRPCQIFIDRCRMLKHAEPGEDWDGSWLLDSK